MSRKLAKIIEEQINSWKHSNSFARSKAPGKKLFPVITISREFGAKGAALANILSPEIGFKVWDKDLLQAIAKETGSGVRNIESLDERRLHTMEDTVYGFLTNVTTNTNFLRSLIRVVKTIEEHGHSIIVGRGANYICQNPKSLHVRVVCPLQQRIIEYSRRENMDHHEARLIVEKKDSERSEFVHLNFHRNVSCPSDYDLLLNSNSFSLEQMADIVIDAYHMKTGISKKELLEV